MKILVISGSYPPETCGVGDYTYNLYNSSVAKRSGWDLYVSRDWSIRSIGKHIAEIKRRNPDVVFMQLPTMGYGWSLVPHLLCIFFSWFSKVGFVVTLHEFTQLSTKARLAASLILKSADHVVFTNEVDCKTAEKKFPRLHNRNSVIKIFSNIERVQNIAIVAERNIDVVNFGHIRPGKGLEIFLDTVQSIKTRGISLKVLLIGQVPRGYERYYEMIARRCDELEVTLRLNLTEKEVAKFLNDSKIAYLPFPDGISDRRGSFLAAASNGAVILSHAGRFTHSFLFQSVVITTPENAGDDILRILSLPIAEQEKLQNLSIRYLSDYMPHSWDEIATAYNTLANSLNDK